MQKLSIIGTMTIILITHLAAVKPEDLKSVKVARLTETLRITDEAGDFAFKRPRRIKVAPDGSIFVSESKALFKFTTQGTFVKNFIKIGEGPSELKNFINFFFAKDGIVTASYMPVKIILSSLAGTLNREFTVFKAQIFTSLLSVINDKYYFNYSKMRSRDLKTGINKNENQIIYCDPKGSLHQTGIKFTTTSALIKQTTEDGRTLIAMDEITRLLTAFDHHNNQLFAVHEARYAIDRFDLNSYKNLGQIKRPYQPVPYTNKPPEGQFDTKIEKIKNREFYNDIYAIRIYDGKLLVFTSKMDKKKRVLVDVFSTAGTFKDRFYLKIPRVERPDDLHRKPMYFEKGYFWTTDMDEDDNPIVIKYKMEI